MNITIRPESNNEYTITEDIIKEAFLYEEYSDKSEHLLVKKIRKSDAFIPQLSLVALTEEGNIIGHVLLSKIKIVDGNNEVDSLSLAPVSVSPHYQKKGIGRQLIQAAIKKAKELGYRSVIVLGHKDYYPKFGFKQAYLWNIQAPFDVADEQFMALELTENGLKNVEGIVHYSKPFLE